MEYCFVSTQRTWGGGERLLSHLIQGLRDLGVGASLAAPSGSAMAQWAASQQGLSLLGLPGRGRGPRALWKLRGWVRQRQCDLLLLNDPHAITTGGLAGIGLPTLRVGVRHTVFPVRSAWKHNRLLDRVVCVSEAARQECLKAGVFDDKVEVIHAGIPWRTPHEESIAEAKRLFAAATESTEEKNVLALGSLLPVKGFDTLVRALALARQEGRAWRLWIAGEGTERESLLDLAAELSVGDFVHLLGYRNDIGALLAAADLFVSASHSEGFSLVVVEAMFAGCPVVATPVGGCREVLGISDSEESPYSWTFAPGDASGLVHAAKQTLMENKETGSRVAAAREWALQHFTAERMARDYLALSKRGKSGRLAA